MNWAVACVAELLGGLSLRGESIAAQATCSSGQEEL
jgi:hypothetical protein